MNLPIYFPPFVISIRYAGELSNSTNDGKKHKTIPKWLLEDEYHIIIHQNGVRVNNLWVHEWVLWLYINIYGIKKIKLTSILQYKAWPSLT